MNKKFKIVSSIALAGMLLTGGLGMNKVNAAEPVDSYDTTMVGVYRKLVAGKTVVPFVLANVNDVLTVNEIVNSDTFRGKVETVNGSKVSSLDQVVGTGDKFTTTDGTEYTVVVYGDVDGNGTIDPNDALSVDKYYLDMLSLDDVQKEAADVDKANANNINPNDSLRIRKYWVELDTPVVVDELPPTEEVVEESNYSMTVNKGGYINNTNMTNSTLEITLNETLDEGKTLKLVLSDSDEETKDVEKTVEIPAHTDYVEFKDGDAISFKDLSDGKITANLYDGDKLVATFETTKNTDSPAVANVRTDRVSTRNATLSLEGMGETKVTKIEYTIKEHDGEKTEVKTGSLDVQDNKLTNVTIADNLENGKVYDLTYTIINEFGSKTEGKTAIIASDSSEVKTAPQLAEVKLTSDVTKDATANFEFVPAENVTVGDYEYAVTLYKDGEAVKSLEAVDNKVTLNKTDLSGVGTYKIVVMTKGDDAGAEYQASEPVSSEEFTVTAVKPVENLALANLEDDEEGNNAILSWTNPNGKDDFASYQIKLYRIDEKGEEHEDKSVTADEGEATCENDKNEVKLNLEENKIYVAKVKLVANNAIGFVDSDEVVSDQFFIVGTPEVDLEGDLTKLGSTSVKLAVDPIEIANKDVTYKVEVYNVNYIDESDPNYSQTIPQYDPNYSTRDVTPEKVEDGYQVTIDGLNPTTDYAFRLVAVVDGNEVKSGYSDPVTTLPVFENVTVTTADDETNVEGSNKVAVDADDKTIIMNGVKYDTDVITELQNAKEIIKGLVAGDVVTMNDDATEVSLVLDGRADNRTFDAGDKFANSTVEITSNKFTKTLSGKFKSLTLKGTGSLFDVTNVTTDAKNPDIILTDGVDVTATASKEYKVEAGATVTINKVKVTTAEEITLTANTGKNLEVDANTTENDITFVNTTEGDANIVFAGAEDNTSEQRGKITIVSNGGTVIVTAPNVNVSADMVVEVTNGTVNVQDPSLTGDKTVTVSADKEKSSTVMAKTVIEAPEKLVGKTVDLAKYKDSDDEIRAYVKDELKVDEELSQVEVDAIREYINSFGLKGTEATIQVTDADTVTITLPGEAQDMEIGNIK